MKLRTKVLAKTFSIKALHIQKQTSTFALRFSIDVQTFVFFGRNSAISLDGIRAVASPD